MNEEDLIEEISVGPGLAKLKSIPLSDEQKQDLKQAQSRRRENPFVQRSGCVFFFSSRRKVSSMTLLLMRFLCLGISFI